MNRRVRDFLYYATPIMTVVAMFQIVYGSYLAGAVSIGIGTICACLASMEPRHEGEEEDDLHTHSDIHAHGAA